MTFANPHRIKDVFDFIDKMNPEENKQYGRLVKDLGLTQSQLVEAAHFTNDKYPDMSLDFSVEDEDQLETGTDMFLKVTLAREEEDDDEEEKDDDDEEEKDDDDEEEFDNSVHCPFFPGERTSGWWLIVGEESTKTVIGIRYVTVGRKPLQLRIKARLPDEAGKHTFKLYMMSDSYVGVDQDPSFTVNVAEGMDEDSEEESDGSE